MSYRTEQRDRVVKFLEFQLVASSYFLSTVRKIVSPDSRAVPWRVGELGAAHSSRKDGKLTNSRLTL